MVRKPEEPTITITVALRGAKIISDALGALVLDDTPAERQNKNTIRAYIQRRLEEAEDALKARP